MHTPTTSWVDPTYPPEPEEVYALLDPEYEPGPDYEPEADTEAGWLQWLIDTGTAWRLEGSVGRAAIAAIEEGRCILGPEGHYDYWGNYVPAYHEVEPGTLGSPEYAHATEEV